MRSKLNPTQIIQCIYDETSNTISTKIEATEIKITADSLIASAIGCKSEDANKDIIPALDCSTLSKVRCDIDGKGTVKIYISPTDTGNFFYEINALTNIVDICGRRIKVTSVDVIGDVHLVGKE